MGDSRRWNSKDSEQTITDLNLEEMFDVFEAADKSIKTSDLPPVKLSINDVPSAGGVTDNSNESKGSTYNTESNKLTYHNL